LYTNRAAAQFHIGNYRQVGHQHAVVIYTNQAAAQFLIGKYRQVGYQHAVVMFTSRTGAQFNFGKLQAGQIPARSCTQTEPQHYSILKITGRSDIYTKLYTNRADARFHFGKYRQVGYQDAVLHQQSRPTISYWK
jgi:hypothetical protein